MRVVYKIVVQTPAKEDAREYAKFILKESKSQHAAKRWLDELDEAVKTLAVMPKRHTQIAEQDAINHRIR